MNIAALLRRREPVSPPAWGVAARSHVGRVRTVNEDRWLDRSDRGLWAVADGMGGHSGGSAAAALAVDLLDALATNGAPIDRPAIMRTLETANRHIHDGAGGAAATSGTTIVVAAQDRDRAQDRIVIAWVGDSRAYRIRHGHAEQLTRDHSVVQELVEAGLVDAAAADRHPRANVVTRALGAAATVVVDTVSTTLHPGDMLLLCSDGVSRSLDPRDFALASDGVDPFADRLLTNALRRDGSDNATLIVIAA